MSVYLMTEAVVHDVKPTKNIKNRHHSMWHAMAENTVVEVERSMS